MTIDPFEKHGLTHISPSQLRMWRTNQPIWIAKNLLGIRDEVGPGAHRGTAVEAGVDRLLFGFDTTDAAKAMTAKWDELTMGVIEPDYVREQEALPEFLAQASIAFGGRSVPLQRQGKISLDVPGISIPLIGYCDWVWPDKGTDLKTTWRMPPNGQPDPNHVDQVTCYSLHYGVPFSLTYVTPKRWTRFEVTKAMAEEAWDRVIETAHALRSFLAHVESGHDAISMFSPDYSSYLFRPAMAEAVRAAKAARVLPAEPRKPQLQVVEP